jgi:hypothetical protein
MDLIRRNLFESPLYVYFALGIAELAIAAVWHERRSRRLKLALLGPVAAAGVVFAVAWLVVTDRERIIAASEEIVRGVEAGSVEPIERYLDERFGGFFVSKEVAVAEARRAIERYAPRSVGLRDVEVTVDGRRADMTATTRVELAASDLDGSPAPRGNDASALAFAVSIDWTLEWVKVRAGGRDVWRIRRARASRWPRD